MTFLELAERVLRETNKPLNSEEIWAISIQKGYDKIIGSKGKTPYNSIAAQVYVNMRDNPKSPFLVTDTRPKKFSLKSFGTPPTLDFQKGGDIPTQSIEKKFEFLEKDLHPFLSYFAFYYLNCYTKTLNHSKSKKEEFGEWVHPDMTGCRFQLEEQKKETAEFSRAIGDTQLKIYSFELKRSLSFSNIREAFFQSVSNSSWANEGYLVAADISNDDDFRKVLRRLSSSFGIGIIQIDITDPDASEVVFPARFKEALDWDAIDNLTMNLDFKDFLNRVKKDIESNEIYKEKYDKVYDKEKLIESIPHK